jgi:hypothetical protein
MFNTQNHAAANAATQQAYAHATLERWLGENDFLTLRLNNAETIVVLPWRLWTRIVASEALK